MVTYIKDIIIPVIYNSLYYTQFFLWHFLVLSFLFYFVYFGFCIFYFYVSTIFFILELTIKLTLISFLL